MQEYVFYCSSLIERIHEDRISADIYDKELRPITDALRKIEKAHGLKKDEYWKKGDAPAEHAALNQKYDAILENKFVEVLEEFGFSDLAKLRLDSEEEFEKLRERGRRSVFHSDEYAEALKDIVRQYEIEAQKAAAVGSYSVAITALGAGLEGLLLLRCLQSRIKSMRLAQKLPRRIRPSAKTNIDKWNFEILIEVCSAAGWLPPIETNRLGFHSSGIAHLLRRMRNYVHPARTARERPWVLADERDFGDASAIYTILLSVLGGVKPPTTDDEAG